MLKPFIFFNNTRCMGTNLYPDLVSLLMQSTGYFSIVNDRCFDRWRDFFLCFPVCKWLEYAYPAFLV